MRNQLIIVTLSSFFVLVSCQNISPEDYKKAAKETCTCVEQMNNDPSNIGKTVDLFYALCTQEIETKYAVQIQSKEFEQALQSDCKSLIKIHEKLTNRQFDFEPNIR